jgi:hypothetical protein
VEVVSVVYNPTFTLGTSDANVGKRVYRRANPSAFGVVVEARGEGWGHRQIQVLYQSGRRSRWLAHHQFGDLDQYLERCRYIQLEARKIEDGIHAFESKHAARIPKKEV